MLGRPIIRIRLPIGMKSSKNTLIFSNFYVYGIVYHGYVTISLSISVFLFIP